VDHRIGLYNGHLEASSLERGLDDRLPLSTNWTSPTWVVSRRGRNVHILGSFLPTDTGRAIRAWWCRSAVQPTVHIGDSDAG
jgi:hypothetical protein